MRPINALLISVPATALMTVPAVAQTYGDHPHMEAWGWGGMIFGPIMMIVYIAVIVGAGSITSRCATLGSIWANRSQARTEQRNNAPGGLGCNTVTLRFFSMR